MYFSKIRQGGGLSERFYSDSERLCLNWRINAKSPKGLSP